MMRLIVALGLTVYLFFSNSLAAEEEVCSTAAAEQYKRASDILRQMLPENIASGMASKTPTASFGSEMSRIAFENAYVQLWTRPGLSLKERSMVTISMLIALGSERELALHFASGLRNGITREELEEIIYHSSAYAGFPRASAALAIAREVVAEEINLNE